MVSYQLTCLRVVVQVVQRGAGPGAGVAARAGPQLRLVERRQLRGLPHTDVVEGQQDGGHGHGQQVGQHGEHAHGRAGALGVLVARQRRLLGDALLVGGPAH